MMSASVAGHVMFMQVTASGVQSTQSSSGTSFPDFRLGFSGDVICGFRSRDLHVNHWPSAIAVHSGYVWHLISPLPFLGLCLVWLGIGFNWLPGETFVSHCLV